MLGKCHTLSHLTEIMENLTLIDISKVLPLYLHLSKIFMIFRVWWCATFPSIKGVWDRGSAWIMNGWHSELWRQAPKPVRGGLQFQGLLPFRWWWNQQQTASAAQHQSPEEESWKSGPTHVGPQSPQFCAERHFLTLASSCLWSTNNNEQISVVLL